MGQLNLQSDESGVLDVAGIGTIDAIADWCESLHGRQPIARALKSLSGCLGVEAAVIARISKSARGESRVVAYDSASKAETRAPLERSFARALLGIYFEGARPGTAWFRSVMDMDVDPALSLFHSRRRFGDMAVIPLEAGTRTIDFLELHFANRQTAKNHALVCILADTLARTWQNRADGQYIESLLRLDLARRLGKSGAPILSVQNPARLSRAEYRVCILLSHGKSCDEIRTELEISESTVRTHLRNIYAKTETHGQSELLYQLMSATPFSPDSDSQGNVA